jgi:ubiquinone biosynthesis accessory factor UbiJ
LSESAPKAKATPAVAFCFLLNQLLDRERWARERLERYAGQSVELRPPLLPPLRLVIAAGGRIEEGGPEPAVVITLDGISGASELADELRYLAKHLRWDAEEELSRLVGDAAAERIGGTVRAFARWQLDAARRVSEALADYATNESGTLVRRRELEDFAAEIERLRAALDRLERRLA